MSEPTQGLRYGEYVGLWRGPNANMAALAQPSALVCMHGLLKDFSFRVAENPSRKAGAALGAKQEEIHVF